MNSAVRNVITLTIITLVAGLCLGYVYDITKKPIADMEERTKQEAYMKVFDSAVSFETDDSIDYSKTQEILDAAGITGVSIDETVKAIDSANSKAGYVITATSHEGYGGDIKISVGIDNSGTVLGVEILSISETAGLGMKAKDESFKSQFNNKAVSAFKYVKGGATENDEIDAISGATITTKAFTNAVNAAIAFFEYLGGGANA